jgi:hypothetical protein
MGFNLAFKGLKLSRDLPALYLEGSVRTAQ